MMLRMIGLVLTATLVAMAAAHLVFQPPSLEGRTMTNAVEASPSTTLGRVVADMHPQQDGKAG